MDFAKDLIDHENVATESGITFLNDTSNGSLTDLKSSKEEDMEVHVNNLLIQAANKAASDMFLSTGSKLYSTVKGPTTSSKLEKDSSQINDYNHLVDCKIYPSKLLPPSSTIEATSLVVVFESFDSLDFVYAKSGDIFYNRNGHFHHDDFIGKPYGCKIRSRNNKGLGFVFLLKPTPELWARSLNHRTQIVHELDSATICFNLNLRPNMVVCESGTGSGAMSHCIMRAISPHGTLHTYEFNEMRAKTAAEEFKMNGVDHLVNVHWRDVCGKPSKSDVGGESEKSAKTLTNDLTFGSGGFNIGQSKAHAIFLDLPEPWLAIPHAAYTMKPNGTICSYSPCMEQTQKTCQKMKEYGFHSLKTIEVRLQEHYVDEVRMDCVPTSKLPRDMNISSYVPGAPNSSSSTLENDQSGHKKSALSADKNSLQVEKVAKKRKLCARPFSMMRGHSAFLTFASAGNKTYPDPNNSEA
mmetsp:Transcript_672/g.831  ORF Transcript_672/g.831 Transcript_672/m.831 type:complete len:467 (+) Transcript_672:154-1554(+)